MLIPVIMAGGVGSRLWPASREARPKQFLTFGGSRSLFQQSLLRLQGLTGVAAPIVVCNETHRFLVAEQLREIGIEHADILLEPVGRNTAPAVTLAALCAQDRPGAGSALLLVLAADHLIPDVGTFHTAIRAGLPHSNGGALVTFGIVPTRAETGYGYIQRGQAHAAATAYEVRQFVEKPDRAAAQGYLDSGEYYWNSGMFMFGARAFLDALGEFEPLILQQCTAAWSQVRDDLDFRRIPADAFGQAPAISIDYAVMERTRHAVVVPLDAGWTDLGAWSAVWEQGPFDDQNNVGHGDVMFQGSCNSFVQSESRLVTLVGMDNAVVVETADAVLVANKARVQEVKDIVQQLNSRGRTEAVSHRKVYRPWGSYEGLAQADGFQVKYIVVKPGAALSLQLHHKRAEHWIVVQGVATVTCGEDVFDLAENESTYIPLGTRHRLENRTAADVTLIEVQCGSYLGEDDIVRFEDVYGRTID
jgi:mannose-1-phosphate guanylyltransferase/mannose-6-phosphate isomerase